MAILQQNPINAWSLDQNDALYLWDTKTFYDGSSFLKRASVHLDEARLEANLLIQSIRLDLPEHMQVVPHMSDTFNVQYHGKAPAHLTDAGILADVPGTGFSGGFGKKCLMD